MSLIEQLVGKLRRHPKRVVFPEGTDERIIQAARQFATQELGVPVLLGDRVEIKERASRLHIRLDGIRIVEPERSEDWDLFLPMVQEHPRFAHLNREDQLEVLHDKHNFAALMLANGRVDALVAGATYSAPSALRSLFKIVSTDDGVKTASSMLILDREEPRVGEPQLFLGDCAVIPEPTAEQLADIAITTARIAYHLTNRRPRVALLSFATRSRKIIHPSIERIRTARELAEAQAKSLNLDIAIDGEMQLDAALRKDVAIQKGMGDSEVAGDANVLIFPDLNSGNIASKMIQVVADTRAYGQIITGLRKPCAEISRGAHAYDIFGTAVISACQAIDRYFLFGPHQDVLRS